MKTLAIALTVAALVGVAETSSAQSITWGNTPGEVLVDSKGKVLTGSWKFELGVFLPGFYPTKENIAEWVPNWVVLDTADYNDEIGYFSSRSPAPQPGAAGLQAYIWVFNDRNYAPSSEWLLLTDRDGNHSNDWMVPNQSDAPTAAAIDWRVSRSTTVLMGSAPKLTSRKVVTAGGGSKIARKVGHRAAPIPAAAIAAARVSAPEAEPTALAGDIAEDFVGE